MEEYGTAPLFSTGMEENGIAPLPSTGMEENGTAPTPSCDMGANPGNDAASPDAKEKGGIACGR